MTGLGPEMLLPGVGTESLRLESSGESRKGGEYESPLSLGGRLPRNCF